MLRFSLVQAGVPWIEAIFGRHSDSTLKMRNKCLETSWANNLQGMWSSRMWLIVIHLQLVHVDTMICVQISCRHKMLNRCMFRHSRSTLLTSTYIGSISSARFHASPTSCFFVPLTYANAGLPNQVAVRPSSSHHLTSKSDEISAKWGEKVSPAKCHARSRQGTPFQGNLSKRQVQDTRANTNLRPKPWNFGASVFM